MKIAMESRALKRLLSGVLRIGATDNTHPGFNLMHLEVTAKGAVRATVVNAVAALRMAAAPKAGSEGLVEPGAIALPLPQAKTFASVLPDTDAVAAMSIIDGGPGKAKLLRVKTGDLLLKQPMGNLDEVVPFPVPPGKEEEHIIWSQATGRDFADIVERVCWAVAPATDHRPTLQGLHVRQDIVECTDAHKVARMNCGLFHVETVLPPAALALPVDLAGKDATLHFAVDKATGRWWCRGPSFMLTARVIDGEFPITDTLFIDDAAATSLSQEAGGRQAPVHRARINSAALRAAGDAIQKVFIASEKDDAPVMRFVLNKGDLNLITRQSGAMGIDIAQRAPWNFTGPPEVAERLPMVNAAYVSKSVDVLREEEDVEICWISRLDRIQMNGKDMRVLIMARTE